MNKEAFLTAIRKKLSGLPKREAEERLNFYSEMIDDRIEEGLSEEEATAAIGSVDAIAAGIRTEIVAEKAEVCEKKPQRRRRGLENVLLVIGSPVWIAFLAVVFACLCSAYAVVWSLIAVLWAVEIPFFAFALFSKYLLIGCRWATEASLLLTKKTVAFVAKIIGGKGRISL